LYLPKYRQTKIDVGKHAGRRSMNRPNDQELLRQHETELRWHAEEERRLRSARDPDDPFELDIRSIEAFLERAACGDCEDELTRSA
jgi:hypothetical protein